MNKMFKNKSRMKSTTWEADTGIAIWEKINTTS